MSVKSRKNTGTRLRRKSRSFNKRLRSRQTRKRRIQSRQRRVRFNMRGGCGCQMAGAGAGATMGQKGGGYSNFITQDLINMARVGGHEMTTTINAMGGHTNVHNPNPLPQYQKLD